MSPSRALMLVLALAGCGESASDGATDLRRGGDLGIAVDAGDPYVDPTDGGAAADGAMACGRGGAKGDRTLSTPSGGRARTSLLHVPQSYDPSRPAMLVLNLHGLGSTAVQQAALSGMVALSDARGFLVAHPYGIAASWNGGKCCGDAWTSSVDDVAYLRALIDQIAAEYCVDARRVHATGMSNGGFMSHRLACELSDRVASIAPVAGVLGVPFDGCRPPRAVPVLHVHGTADRLVPYGGGGTLKFPSVADTIAHWRARNGCGGGPVTAYQKGDATCARWTCAADVELCTIDGGGHTWPGGVPLPTGKTSRDLDASARIVDFFAAHPM